MAPPMDHAPSGYTAGIHEERQVPLTCTRMQTRQYQSRLQLARSPKLYMPRVQLSAQSILTGRSSVAESDGKTALIVQSPTPTETRFEPPPYHHVHATPLVVLPSSSPPGPTLTVEHDPAIQPSSSTSWTDITLGLADVTGGPTTPRGSNVRPIPQLGPLERAISASLIPTNHF